MPEIIKSEAVETEFSDATFCIQSGVEEFMKIPLVQLTEKLLDKRMHWHFIR